MPADGPAGEAGTDLADLHERSPVAATVLPAVVHATPAAVLLVDLDHGDVVYANPLAAELAPGMRLPLSVDDWSRAAGLQDTEGDDLAGDRGDPSRPGRGRPLSRVARGEPVLGEAVTAARPGRGFARREPLWVVGLPLEDAPGALGRQAVVLFLPIRQAGAVAEAQESAAGLRDRALLATRISITITDPRQPDNPLIWVNPAFLDVSGRSREEVLGRNCRFLQGPDTDRAVVAEIARAIEHGEAIATTLRNYRADGTAFWNRLSISPVLDAAGVVTHFVGVQADVTDQVEAESAREQALARARAAHDRLALLAATTNRLAGSLDPAEIVQLLARLVVPRLGSWSVLFTTSEVGLADGPFVRLPGASGDAGARPGSSVDLDLADLPADHPVALVLRGERGAGRVPDLAAREGGLARLAARYGSGSAALAPVTARGGVLGALLLVRDPGDPPYDDDDVAVLADVCARAGLALDNARLFAREHLAAETLQRALLPVLPEIEGLDVSAEYLPATARNAVGGDWYDLLRLRDGSSVGIAIGDVMGHDLAAAAAMGQLRSVLRSYAYPGASPSSVLEQLDQLVQSLQMGSLATCVYGRVTRDRPGADAEFVWANAGHPPPLLMRPDGTVAVLTSGASRLVGLPFRDDGPGGRAVREEGRTTLPVGSTLLLYTDGLVETRDRDIDETIAALRDAFVSLGPGLPAAEVVRRFGERQAVDTRDDDVAMLVVRVL